MKQGELARRVIKKDIYNLECEVERLNAELAKSKTKCKAEVDRLKGLLSVLVK